MEREDRIEQRLLLEDGIPLRNGSCGLYTGDGSVNFRGQPVSKSNSGNWRACIFILGTECCERLAFYGIAMNLVTYLTQNLHEGNVAAARNVSIWGGTCSLTPLFGAVLADAYWGRYWTIAAFSTFYFLGMCALTLSATVPYFKPAECVGSLCPPATTTQYTIFFFGLYLISLGTGGIKPCVSSFGADQFDDTDPIERVKKQFFFNWFYFTINIGALLSSTLIVWIQDNIGWGIGFVIPALFMGIAVVSFFSGTSLYRFQPPGGSPLTKVCQVLVASIKKWKLDVPADGNLLYETPDKISAVEGSKKLEHTNDLRFLDKASVVFYHEGKNGDSIDPWILCTVTQVEELKILIRMFPIWATGIVFSSVFSQMGTMFLEQGLVMDRKVGPFTIPAASLSAFDVISVILWVPLYDWALVPIACKFTGNERGFSQLQRMGIGLFISIFSMLAAALVETKRLEIARSLELDENVYVPLNILWQMPQYSLIGCAEVFTYIGQLEFFYDQSPDAMRSLCSAFALLTSSLGSYLNSFIITVVSSTGWLPDNLNKGHLDYYFCFLAGLSFLNLVVYVTCAKMYKQKKTFR